LTPDKYKCNLYSRYLAFCRGGLLPAAYLQNDFEGPVFKRFPAVRKIKEDFAMYHPDGVLMSGSGSTVFGLFRQGRRARAAAARFRQNRLWVCITRPMTH
jgi:4-diphosphocytidyl-2C-methyl-D-erythritol kinase